MSKGEDRTTVRVLERRRLIKLGRVALALALSAGVGAAVGVVPADATSPQPTTTTTSWSVDGAGGTTTGGAGVLSFSFSGSTSAALLERPDRKHVVLLTGGLGALKEAGGVAALAGARENAPRVHVGSDADGRPVVIYPRCSEAASPSGCRLVSYSVPDQVERRIPGVPRGAFEGVMRRGALLYASVGSSSSRGLWYRPNGAVTRRLAAYPGTDLALSRSRAAHVIADGEKTAGEEPCTNSAVVLRSLRGGPGEVLARRCDFGTFGARRSLSFSHATLSWAGRGRSVYRFDPGRGAVEQATLPTNLFDVILVGRTSDTALASVVGDGTPTPEDRISAANAIVRVDGLRWRLAKEPVQAYGWDDPALLR